MGLACIKILSKNFSHAEIRPFFFSTSFFPLSTKTHSMAKKCELLCCYFLAIGHCVMAMLFSRGFISVLMKSFLRRRPKKNLNNRALLQNFAKKLSHMKCSKSPEESCKKSPTRHKNGSYGVLVSLLSESSYTVVWLSYWGVAIFGLQFFGDKSIFACIGAGDINRSWRLSWKSWLRSAAFFLPI